MKIKKEITTINLDEVADLSSAVQNKKHVATKKSFYNFASQWEKLLLQMFKKDNISFTYIDLLEAKDAAKLLSSFIVLYENNENLFSFLGNELQSIVTHWNEGSKSVNLSLSYPSKLDIDLILAIRTIFSSYNVKVTHESAKNINIKIDSTIILPKVNKTSKSKIRTRGNEIYN